MTTTTATAPTAPTPAPVPLGLQPKASAASNTTIVPNQTPPATPTVARASRRKYFLFANRTRSGAGVSAAIYVARTVPGEKKVSLPP